MLLKIIVKQTLRNVISRKTSQTFPLCNYSTKKIVEALPYVLKKYEPFKDEKSPIILDVEEERRKNMLEEGLIKVETELFKGIDPHRGLRGIIDIDELVMILRNENAQDIFVARVPSEYRYVEHIVVVSGKSARHMLGMVEFVRQVYKYKANGCGNIPLIEGKKSHDWIALDLGNIALHVFSKRKRLEYDLESLWSVGPEFDDLVNISDEPVIQLITQHATNYVDQVNTYNR